MNRNLIWQLIKLRYKLNWAQARTSSGKVVLMLIGYTFVAGMVLLFLILGGASGAASAKLADNGGLIIRGLLGLLFGAGIIAGIMFGVGPRAVFADNVLRRYPLNAKQRFVARHLIGLFDPTWPLLLSGALGLVISLAIAGRKSIIIGLPVALLIIVVDYLIVAALLSFIDRVMQRRNGAAIVYAVIFLPFSLSGIILPRLLDPRHPARYAVVDKILQMLPPGAASNALIASDAWLVALNLLVLLFWAALLISILALVEQRAAGSQSRGSAKVILTSGYDRVVKLFGPRYGPFAAKSLRYYFRSNQVRLGFITVPVMVLMGPFLGRNGGGGFLMTLAMFAFVGVGSNSAITTNQFGYDGAGIRRYALLPISFAEALRAGSLVGIFMGCVAIIPSIFLYTMLFVHPFDPRRVIVLVLSSLAGLLLFSGLAIFTSVLSPWPADLVKVMGNKPPVVTQFVIAGWFMVFFPAAMVLGQFIELSDILANWWVFLAFLLVALAFYIMSVKAGSKLAIERREKIIETIAATNYN